MIVAAQQGGGMPMQRPQGLMQLPTPQMQAGAGIGGSGMAIDRDTMIRDYMRTQGMDPDDPKNATELAKLEKEFGVMDAIKSAPARGMQKIEDAGKGIQSIFDMMKNLGS